MHFIHYVQTKHCQPPHTRLTLIPLHFHLQLLHVYIYWCFWWPAYPIFLSSVFIPLTKKWAIITTFLFALSRYPVFTILLFTPVHQQWIDFIYFIKQTLMFWHSKSSTEIYTQLLELYSYWKSILGFIYLYVTSHILSFNTECTLLYVLISQYHRFLTITENIINEHFI